LRARDDDVGFAEPFTSGPVPAPHFAANGLCQTANGLVL
jgi:hypothetical protein